MLKNLVFPPEDLNPIHVKLYKIFHADWDPASLVTENSVKLTTETGDELIRR